MGSFASPIAMTAPARTGRYGFGSIEMPTITGRNAELAPIDARSGPKPCRSSRTGEKCNLSPGAPSSGAFCRLSRSSTTGALTTCGRSINAAGLRPKATMWANRHRFPTQGARRPADVKRRRNAAAVSRAHARLARARHLRLSGRVAAGFQRAETFWQL